MRAVTVGIVLAAVVGAASSLLFGARLAHAPEDSGGARNPLTAVGRQPEVVQAPTSALWVDLAQQRVPRQEMAVAELGGRIYAIGGFNPDGSSANTVEAYDPATDSWATVAPLPIALNHPAAATVGDHVYVIGGHPDQGAEAVDTVYAYDAGADRWVPRARMPTARGALAVAVADGKIYAMGGSPDRRERDFAVYDPDADAWTPLPAMPTPRNHLAAGALNGKIYAVGGRSGDIGGITAALEEYDPGARAWTAKAPMPTARGGIAAAVVGGSLYVFGGEGNRNNPTGVFDEVEAYDPATDSWLRLAPMGAPRHGIGAAALENRIYIPGGASVEGFGVTPVNQALDVQ
ncbi:MAG TPA: kelch repeat-containing protein [Chloroflexota bacterium]|nr:kelch repeat-containing protein [Chloroflexota bacterium]